MYKIKKQIKVMTLAVLCLAGVLMCNVTVQAASADNSLSSLTLSEGTLSPSFQYNVVNYKASVGSGTNSIEVQAKTSNEKASIQSGTGTYDLKEGSNTIKVVVQAENGNLATYTVQVTKEAGSGTTGTDGSQSGESDTDGAADTPDEGSSETPAVVTGADGYTVADSIPESVIPADFTQTTVSYLEEDRPALQYDKGEVTLLYMVNEENEGMLFLYDGQAVYPFIKLSAQDKYLILLPVPAEAALGENYTSAELAIDNKNVPSAYQDAAAVSAAPDFYQVYGINSDGVTGWYQYDSAEGTYQRYQAIEPVEADEEISEEYQFLQKAYNDLSDKYSELKSRDTKYMAGLIIAIAVLLIIIVNLLLLRREKGGNLGKRQSKEIFDEDVKEKKEKKKKSKKERRIDAEEILTGSGFYEKDEDSFADFDEEPDFRSGKRELREKKDKKEKKEKKKRFGKKGDIFDDGDDYFDEEMPLMGTNIEETPSLEEELEILDLNDL